VVRPVTVLIEDRRLTPAVKLVERMELSVANKADDSIPQDGGWWLSANELLLKLQGSNAAISGEST
jgi:hypothetical protein